METKSAPLVEIKTNSTPGEFTAVISAIGNVDLQGDMVMPLAFEKAMSEDLIPPVYWAHKHDTPPIGEGLDWKEIGKDVVYQGRLFVKGDIEHPVANMVYAGMKSYDGRVPAIRQFSFTYGVPEGGAERVMLDGKMVRQLKSIYPVAEVGPCFIGANPETGLISAAKTVDIPALVAMKADGSFQELDFFQLGSKAEWDTAYVDALPDSAFLYVEPGGKRDSSGKTDPRSLRHFPYKNAQGQVDMPHLRDAISRAPQASTLSQDVRDRVAARAQRILRSQEGKAILLASVFSSKAWDDVEGWEISRLLEMLDDAVSFIQFEDDPGSVAQMQGIVSVLLTLLGDEFDDLASAEAAEEAVEAAAEAAGVPVEEMADVEYASVPLVALGAATKLYLSAANLTEKAAADYAGRGMPDGKKPDPAEDGSDTETPEEESNDATRDYGKTMLSDPALTVKDSTLARLLHR